jgi:large subunit ribosomal protein L13
MTKKDTHTIDAKGKRFGRVASEAAKVLMGKTTPHYEPHTFTGMQVKITNAGSLDISERKLADIEYKRYSGHPGGQRVETLRDLKNRRGIETALRKTIERMLPRNTLRKKRLKHLTITQ